MNKTILRARNLFKAYHMGKAVVRVLRGASLHAERGEFLVVMGASGSGKSTLLHLLGALDVPDKGSVEFCDRDLFLNGAAARSRYRNHEVGFVFQFYHLLPELSVLANVALPRLVTHGVIQWFAARREARDQAKAIIERVGLTKRIRHRPNELSGGELQRVAIARALINKPSLLLADEPTGNLDAASGKEILELLEELNRDGQTIIMVTHDAQVAARAHRRVQLEEGRIRTK
ncbi:MAG: ABC transporter ATP-binding protein [Phycisphaerales bacterium]|nr:MAG: ABC transporter ATP-binding protein [Phycisphaerales bacterium]